MESYTLHPMTEADKEQVRDLNQRCYRDLVERQFGKWDEEVQRQFFENKWDSAKFQKILIDGKMAGLLSLQRHADHLFLSEIQVAPEFQGHGIGTTILRDILDSAADSGLPVKLQVLNCNRAIALYRRLNFVTTGKTDTHVLLENTPKPTVQQTPIDESTK